MYKKAIFHASIALDNREASRDYSEPVSVQRGINDAPFE